MNLTTDKILEMNLNILKELHLSKTETLQILEKLKGYKYIDEMNELKYGAHIRWVPLEDPENIQLKQGAMFCEMKIKEEGVYCVCKNYGYKFRYFQLSFDKNLIFHYRYQLAIFIIYSIMSMGPGLYFIAPQIFPFELGIPAFRDHFYPVLAFLIMILMLNEQKQKELDSIFTLAMTKANADIEIEKNKKQHVFLGMLLHEIKTPLSVIRFGAASLKSSNTDKAKNLIWIDRVDAAVDSINHILNQCLLADKFEFGLSGYKAETVEIYTEVIKIIERIGLLNSTYSERIKWYFGDELSLNTSAEVDPIFLRSVLENLLSNALKYAAPNSIVDLKIFEHSFDKKGFIKFEIKNQIGKVGPPDIDKLFSRYYRAEEAKGYSGTGLGLWLANQQAKEMGSNIDCKFDDTWTTFSFQVPNLNDAK
jgi:signal transduction histidine kinase